MFRLILSIAMIAAAIGIFIGFVNPRFSNTKELKAQVLEFDQALDNFLELQRVKESLLADFNAFAPADLDRLEQLLPSNIDNVKLILELDRLARSHGLLLQNIKVRDIQEEERNAPEGGISTNAAEFSVVGLEFSTTGEYEDFIAFLRDLEKSLRLIDVDTLSFASNNINTQYTYAVKIKTYWIRN